MKKVLSFAAMIVFVAGIAVAQTTPAKKTVTPAKTEAKADTTKKVQHKKVAAKKTTETKVESKKK